MAKRTQAAGHFGKRKKNRETTATTATATQKDDIEKQIQELTRLRFEPPCLETELPLRTVSENNQREHWAAKAKRVKLQRTGAAFVVHGCRAEFERAFPDELRLPLLVRLTRVSQRALDSDNLRGALKAIRDGVADAFGSPTDGPSFASWHYAQATSLQPGVIVEIWGAKRPK